MCPSRSCFVHEVDGQRERTFQAGGHRRERIVAAEADADLGIALAIDRQRRGDFDVGVPERLELLLPVRVLEFDEESPQCPGVVQRYSRGVHLDLGRPIAWRRGLRPVVRRPPRGGRAQLRMCGQVLPRRGPLVKIEDLVAIPVEATDQRNVFFGSLNGGPPRPVGWADALAGCCANDAGSTNGQVEPRVRARAIAASRVVIDIRL